MLVALGGLPGTGKTTIAQIVARRCHAVYIRIDTIEQAIRSSGGLTDDIGPAGYNVGYALAESNLRLGLSVIADSVNPLVVTRHAWRAVARAASCACLEVEIICSDEAEHRRRIESRTSDIPGHIPPDWHRVITRHYEPWPEAHLVIDTALLTPQVAAETVISLLRKGTL